MSKFKWEKILNKKRIRDYKINKKSSDCRDEFENDYDNEGLEDNEEDEEEILNNDENVVSLWMYRIANRQQDDEFKYNDVLEEWRKDLCNPDVDAKRRFKDI